FGDLFGNLQRQQEQMQQQLAAITVEAESGDGAVTVQASGDMRISNIRLDASKIDLADTESLEDLLVVAVNRALDAAKQKAAQQTQEMLGGMMPGGLLDGLMKGG
ncbi:MAG TPA: YbaB/EbfC family nucleoid-associated protein, partial [Saprospiraceae bacterium]|nr:YbaB/EbfC family nucleoid-associated protein [Saprospiraceae bacterium]